MLKYTLYNYVSTCKANNGNFLGKDVILLEKNVSFESRQFKIYSERV